VASLLGLAGCRRAEEAKPTAAAKARPSILLVTLDTTRADAIGPEARGATTPAFNALAARGQRFRQAYATAPETLPSHASMMTGLYPAGHGVHENARALRGDHPLLADRLRKSGYRTAAFVSAFALARRFGLARGFEVYDDEFPAGRAERSAQDTTDRALAFVEREAPLPLFLWVHYYDPHAPYTPPEPFRSRYANDPYRGEVAAMDAQLGRLVQAFEAQAGGPFAVLVVSDHGEGLGEHGEAQHGRLLYQATQHVPLLLVGPGTPHGVSDEPVSARRVYHTVLEWAGLGAANSLRGPVREIVLAEAMKPFLQYGWQPQTMAIEGRHKAIRAGRLEVYDVVADPGEERDISPDVTPSRELRTALLEYPVPSLEAAAAADALGEDERRQLASLGYVAAGAVPSARKDAPRPVDMASLFEALDQASGLFVREEYQAALPLLRKILARDPANLDTALRLASAHSALGHHAQALDAFRRAEEISPRSPDVRAYLALHYARGNEWPRAVPLLERVLAETPDRLPALEALAAIRERQGRLAEGLALRQRVYKLRKASPAELIQLGQAAMSARNTDLAIESFEAARAEGGAPPHDLVRGVLDLDARRFPEARDALDRVPPSHPAYPMALFKRAQVSVLLGEPDQAARIALARERADATTRALVARERLFEGERR
jgi:tetratricopeptide (TPR) repeat protein